MPWRRGRRGDRPRPAPSRAKSQQWYVNEAYPDLLPGPGGWNEPVEFFYEAGTLLVQDEYADRVTDILRAIGKVPDRSPDAAPGAAYADYRPTGYEPPNSVAGIQVIRLIGAEEELSTIDTLRLLRHGTPAITPRGRVVLPDWAQPVGDVVTPHTALHIAGGDGGMCPANEPEPVKPGTLRWPRPTRDTFAGEGVRVVVIDTPLDPATRDATPWMQGIRGVQGPPGPNMPAGPDRYRGHGTFIAGIIRTVAPRAEVIVRGLFQRRGVALETEVLSALYQTLIDDDPDIISLSAGTHTFENTGLIGLNAFYERRLRHHKGVVLVAAAGNDDNRQPFWPAATPWAVSAGALNSRGDGRADYSNHGGWVDVYAQGTDLINAYPKGWYTYEEPPWDQVKRVEKFTGLARWSGTSFSTPVVSGMIAARMSHTGENGRTAAAALVRDAQAVALPGVGAVLMAR